MAKYNIQKIMMNELNGIENDWWEISQAKLDDDFIKEFKDKIQWHYLCASKHPLSIEIIDEFKDTLIDWSFLSANKKLSEQELEMFFQYINWEQGKRIQTPSADFVDRHINEIGITNAVQMKHLPYSFYEKYIPQFKHELKYLFYESDFLWLVYYHQAPLDFLEKHIFPVILKDQDQINGHFGYLQHQECITPDYIKSYAPYLNKENWKTISSCFKLNESFIEEFQDQLSWPDIAQYQKLSMDFIKKYQKKFSYKRFEKSKFITREMLKEISTLQMKNLPK